jgi:hypothetical protein
MPGIREMEHDRARFDTGSIHAFSFVRAFAARYVYNLELLQTAAFFPLKDVRGRVFRVGIDAIRRVHVMSYRMHVHTPVGARILYVFQLGFAEIFAKNLHWVPKN